MKIVNVKVSLFLDSDVLIISFSMIIIDTVQFVIYKFNCKLLNNSKKIIVY